MTAPGEPILPAPAPPDFLLCDPAYGRNIETRDCLLAAGNLERGAEMVRYVLSSDPRNNLRLPQSYKYGTCRISVQFSYFRGVYNRGLVWYDVAPNDLRNLAAKVIQQCVIVGRGIGGFGTFGISALLEYASLGYTPYNLQTFPATTAFLTVHVMTSSGRILYPGDTDPSIAVALAEAASKPSAARSGSSALDISPSDVWLSQLEQMSRAGRTRWYTRNTQFSDEMEYQCDALLGAPSAVDCTQIEWNQLTPPSDTLAVGPGVTTFLHSNTCYLAISAVVSLVLTWAQIRTAVSVLMNICIQAPLQPPRGGRAHYAAPLQISRRKIGKRQRGEVTGLNALPKSVNITIFEQREGWEGSAAELTSCTWTAVSKGTSISNCHSA